MNGERKMALKWLAFEIINFFWFLLKNYLHSLKFWFEENLMSIWKIPNIHLLYYAEQRALLSDGLPITSTIRRKKVP